MKISAATIAVGRNFDGRLELFYAGAGHANLYHWQIEPADSTDPQAKLNFWSGETAFVGNRAKQIAVANNVDGRLEIFYVGSNNDLFHNWQTQTPDFHNQATLNTWAGEVRFAKNSADQVTVGTNSDGRLEIFYVGLNNELFHNWQNQPPDVTKPGTLNSWHGEIRFAKNSAKQIAAVTNSMSEIEIFYKGADDHLFRNAQKMPSNSNDPSTLNSWIGEEGILKGNIRQVSVAPDAAQHLEIIYSSSSSDLFHMPQRSTKGTLFGSNVGQNVSGSNSENLVGVSVLFNITQDLVCPYATGGIGYSFQFNCFSPQGSNCVWQQYAIGMNGNKIGAWIDNWPGKGSGDLINDFFTIATLPDPKLPAGFQLQISLGVDDKFNVAKVSFSVFDQNAALVASVEKDLLQLAHGKVDKLAPIIAMGVQLVGYDNDACSLLSSGAGNIIYQADNALVANDSVTNEAASPGRFTEEIANSVYGPLLPDGRTVVQQTFSVGLITDQLA